MDQLVPADLAILYFLSVPESLLNQRHRVIQQHPADLGWSSLLGPLNLSDPEDLEDLVVQLSLLSQLILLLQWHLGCLLLR